MFLGSWLRLLKYGKEVSRLLVTSGGRSGWFISLTSTQLYSRRRAGVESLGIPSLSFHVGYCKGLAVVRWLAADEVLQYGGFSVAVAANMGQTVAMSYFDSDSAVVEICNF